MRCTGYCTAASYDVLRLFQTLGKLGPVQLYKDTLHFQIREERRVRGDLFYFSYGAVVFWGFSEEEERKFLQDLKEFERDSCSRTEDEFTYIYGDDLKIEEDEIVLQNKGTLTKLAIAHGIAQSVKLNVFEDSIFKTYETTKWLPAELAVKGKISLSRRAISRKMGELFIERNTINIHTEILDTPEFFWEHPELETFYRRTAHYLDINKRVDILNRRLNVIHELFEILRNELNHQYSSRLEWTIIVLIVIEVVLAVLRDIFHVI
ncbi:MAG: RMD1 family protein [Simkania sp.]|nr:RMD1 family protein [Simkania sp.]